MYWPPDAGIHKLGQTARFSVDLQDGKAIPFTLGEWVSLCSCHEDILNLI
jgi:hypothetical protein